MANWGEIKHHSAFVDKVASLQTEIENHLKTSPQEKLPEALARWVTRDAICNAFQFTSWQLLAPHGRSVADLLFLLHVYGDTAIQGGRRLEYLADLADKTSLPEVLKELRNWATQVTDEPHSLTDQAIFDQCAALLIFHVQHSAQDTLEQANGFGLDYGDPNDEYKGDEETKLDADELDIKELTRMEKEEKDEAIARGFLPWCSRVFPDMWKADLMKAKYPLDEKFNWQVVRTAYANFENWMMGQLKLELPKQFYNSFSAWVYRAITAVGAEAMYRRMPVNAERHPDAAELFQRDADIIPVEKLPYKQWIACKKPVELLSSPVGDLVQLAAFAALFDCRYKDKKEGFATRHVVFRQDSMALIDQDTRQLKPRRPLIVQFLSGWRVHDAKHWIVCESIRDALLAWCHLVKTKYRSRLLDDTDISEFLGIFYQ